MDPLHIVGLSVLGTLLVIAFILRLITIMRMEKIIAQNTVLTKELLEIIPANVDVLNQLHAQQEAVVRAMGGESPDDDDEDHNVMGFKHD